MSAHFRSPERLEAWRDAPLDLVVGDDRIEAFAVMALCAREVLARSAQGGRTIAAMTGQSKVDGAHRMPMVPLRAGGRALPLAWRMMKPQGAIGFREQKEALEATVALLPEGPRQPMRRRSIPRRQGRLQSSRVNAAGRRPTCLCD